MNDETPAKKFDWESAADLVGATPLQLKFAQARVQGANRTQAARMAGYSGSDSQLRKAGSDADKSEAVKRLMTMAQAAGEDVPDELCDSDDLKRILSRLARGKDKNVQIRACEVLNRISAAEMERRRDEEVMGDPLKTLDEIAEVDPLYAESLARSHGLAWQPTAEHRAAILEAKRKIAMEYLNEMKAQSEAAI